MLGGAIFGILFAVLALSLSDSTDERDAPFDQLATACNLIEVAEFERGQLGLNYFTEPADTGRLSGGVGRDGSIGVLVGLDSYGLYGELVANLADDEHVFGAWLDVPATAGPTEVRVSFLDVEYAPSDEVGWQFVTEVDTPFTGVVVLPTTRPDGAMHAVPHVRTDGPEPVAVDDLVFTATTCP